MKPGRVTCQVTAIILRVTVRIASMTVRANGRGNEEIQNLTVGIGGLSRVDGSSRFGFGSFSLVDRI